MTNLERKLVEAARALLAQADDGPAHCAGVMQDGAKCWKGSFIAKMETLRDLLPEPVEAEPS